MTALHERWRDGLEAEALTVDVPLDDAAPVRVMRRARRRHRRNQGSAALACVALLAGSGLAWKANQGGPAKPTKLVVADEGPADPIDDSRLTTSPAYDGGTGLQVDPATLPPVNLVPSSLAWSARDVAYGKGVGGQWFGPSRPGSAGLVTVSTLPGVRADDGARAIYTSADGITWAKGGELTGRHWFGDMTATARGLVAVGTAAATAKIKLSPGGAGTGDAVVAVSTDQGHTFRDIVLPLDLRGVKALADAGRLPMSVGVVVAKIAVGAAGTLVAVQASAMPDGDFRSLVPVGIDTSNGATFGPDGVTILKYAGYPRLVVDRVVPWSELGVDPAVGALVGGGGLHLFQSTDGETFVEVPAPAGTAGLQQLVATPSGFALVAQAGQGLLAKPGQGQAATVWITDDARTWTPTEPLPFDVNYGMPPSIGWMGGRLVAAGTYHGWPAVAVADGSAWRLTPLGNGVAPAGSSVALNQVAIGEGGVAFALDAFVDPVAGLVSHAGGLTLRVDGQARGIAVIEDATGRELARFADVYNPDTTGVLKPVYDPSSPSRGGPVPTVPASTIVGPGVAGTAPPGASTTTGPRPPPNVYTVRAGDVWVAIAQRFAVTPEALAAANPGHDPNTLQVGDRLVVPAPNAGPVDPTATTTTILGLADAQLAQRDKMNASDNAGPGGAAGLQVLDPATGAVRATFDLAELRGRFERAMTGAGGRAAHTALLLTSTDTVGWSLVDLAALAGAPVEMVTGLFSTDAGLVVTVATTEADPAAPPPSDAGAGPIKRQRALVGVRS